MYQFNETAIFMATPMKKHLVVPCTNEYFSSQFVDRKVAGLTPKYSLFAGVTNLVYM